MVVLPPVYFAWMALTVFTHCALTRLMKRLFCSNSVCHSR